MEIDEAGARRLAIRFKSTLKLAHRTAPTAGRQARQLHAEAMQVNDVCQTLLGNDLWHQFVQEAVND